jgi:DNA-binding SARP family transcriptional activator
MVAASTIDARLLGPLEVEAHGAPVALGPAKQRALLARLLLDANRTVALDRLLDDLWGEDVPRTAVKMIHIHVSKLRKLLPAGVLVTRPPGYAVTIPPEALDLVRFERLREPGRTSLAGGSARESADRLREALALWRGPALAEFDAPFAAIDSGRLEDLRLACVEDRIDADLALGRHTLLVGELDALVARQPLRERLQGQLILALYRSGQQAQALAAYRKLRQMLAHELGIEPSPALRELERRMLQQDPALDVAAVEPRPRPGAPAASPMRGLSPNAHSGWPLGHRGEASAHPPGKVGEPAGEARWARSEGAKPPQDDTRSSASCADLRRSRAGSARAAPAGQTAGDRITGYCLATRARQFGLLEPNLECSLSTEPKVRGSNPLGRAPRKPR